MNIVRILTINLVLLLSGCAAFDKVASIRDIDVGEIPDAVPKVEKRSETGNQPYRVYGELYIPMATAAGYKERGVASWYGPKFHGKRTSSGETYDMYAMTAAHKTLPLPSYVSVRNLKNRRKIVVKVNDRGPFIDDRIIDLSYVAAKKLGMIEKGTAKVEVKAIHVGSLATGRSGKQKLYLQLAAFSSKQNARAFSADIKQKKWGNIDIDRVKVSGRTIYRVSVGPIKQKHLNKIIKQISGELGIVPQIVSE